MSSPVAATSGGLLSVDAWALIPLSTWRRIVCQASHFHAPGVELQQLTNPGLNHLPVVPKTVRTPTGIDFPGVAFQGRICGVSIMRGT